MFRHPRKIQEADTCVCDCEMKTFLSSTCCLRILKRPKWIIRCFITCLLLHVLITVALSVLPDNISWTISAYWHRKRFLDEFNSTSRHDTNMNKLWWKYYAKSMINNTSYIEEMNELNDIECKSILSKYHFWVSKKTTINPANILVIDVSMYYNEIDMFEARFYELYDSVDLFVINEFTITCSSLKQEKIQFIDNLKQYKPYLYYNHFLPSNAKPKIVHFVIDAYEKRNKGYNIRKFGEQNGRDAMRSFILDFLDPNDKSNKLLNLKFNETIYNITNGRRSVKNSLINDDIFIFSDLDEIPRGIMVHFLFKSKCSKYINNVYNSPISIDFLQYAYDFGCKMTGYKSCDKKGSKRKKREKKNPSTCEQWRHGGMIRYGQLNLNIDRCLVVHNVIIRLNKSKHWYGASYGGRKTWYDYDDQHNICYYDLRRFKIRYYEKFYQRRHWGEAQYTYPITIVHGGWHLTSFYKNYTHKMGLKLKNSQDKAKHSNFTKDHVECYRMQCVELLRRIYSEDMYVHKYFQLSQLKNAMEFQYNYSKYNEYNNYRFRKKMFPTHSVHAESSYSNTDILMDDKIVYYNFTKFQDILKTKIDYPQWILKQAIYEKNPFWLHMFPQKPAQISQKEKEMCQKTPLLVTRKKKKLTQKQTPNKPKWVQ